MRRTRLYRISTESALKSRRLFAHEKSLCFNLRRRIKVNSEELEQSLKTEFEDYLKRVFADVREEVSALQDKVEQEFERHRTQLAEAFAGFKGAGDAGSENELDAGFRASVVEHLRLARDEGARITATAIAEAEAMEKEAAASAPKRAGIGELRDGIAEICAQNSQASILKSLVAHAGQFTPRGAFFIVKNEHLVGWRVFGRDEQENQSDADAAVRAIYFSVADETVLGESIKSLNAVESSYGEYRRDSLYLERLGFGEPEKMVAIPLVARGRGVAVLYADGGESADEINIEALETLVRVAGLTVEVLAAGNAPAPTAAPTAQQQSAPANLRQTTDYAQTNAQPAPQEDGGNYRVEETEEFAEKQTAPVTSFDYAAPIDSAYQSESPDNDYFGEKNYQPESAGFDAVSNDYSATDYAVETVEETQEEDAEEETAEFAQPAYQAEQTESYSWNQPQAEESFASDEVQEAYSQTDAASGNQYQFEDNQSYGVSTENNFEIQNTPGETRGFESEQYATPAYEPASSASTEGNYASFEQPTAAPTAENGGANGYDFNQPQPAAETKPARSRFSDRNIDLPVEVSEDERRLHNDARRFARLLVSEIKLYNEQKVKEGRDENDLYERLREAIDRSREMYDKRVQPPVAAKFDYFHYELVNSLAEGDEAKLGESYVGATA
jgi:hypothetical protein